MVTSAYQVSRRSALTFNCEMMNITLDMLMCGLLLFLQLHAYPTTHTAVCTIWCYNVTRLWYVCNDFFSHWWGWLFIQYWESRQIVTLGQILQVFEPLFIWMLQSYFLCIRDWRTWESFCANGNPPVRYQIFFFHILSMLLIFSILFQPVIL